jgi:acyl-CoA thioester hydrolase
MTDFSAAAVPLDVTVRFAETDLMGIVHHSVYIVWFEAGRVAWMEAAGLPYTQIAASGHHFAVVEIHAHYRAAIRFGDPVQVITRLSELRSRQVDFAYQVRHAQDGTLMATGTSHHICVDEAGRTTRIPAWVLTGLRQGASALAADG